METKTNSAIELVAGEIPAILSSWERISPDDEEAPGEAVDLLAVWAHMQRFPEDARPRELWTSLDDTVRRDRRKLCALASQALDPEGWIEAVKALEAVVDGADDLEKIGAADSEALRLLIELDSAELANWAAAQLEEWEEDVAVAPVTVWTVISGRLLACHHMFMEELTLFLGARDYAAGLWAAYRKDFGGSHDPFGSDEALGAITEKIGRLASAFVVDGPEPLTAEEWRAFRAAYRARTK